MKPLNESIKIHYSNPLPVGSLHHFQEHDLDHVLACFKHANPHFLNGTKTVISEKGIITITFPDFSTITISAEKLFIKKTHAELVHLNMPTEVKVQNINYLSQEERNMVHTAFLSRNEHLPEGSTVYVERDGSLLVKFKDMSYKYLKNKSYIKAITMAESIDFTFPEVLKVEDINHLSVKDIDDVRARFIEENPHLLHKGELIFHMNGNLSIKFHDQSTINLGHQRLFKAKSIAEMTTIRIPSKIKVKQLGDLSLQEKHDILHHFLALNHHLDESQVIVEVDGSITVSFNDDSILNIEHNKLIQAMTLAESTPLKIPTKTIVDNLEILTVSEQQQVVKHFLSENPELRHKATLEIDDDLNLNIQYHDDSMTTINKSLLIKEGLLSEKIKIKFEDHITSHISNELDVRWFIFNSEVLPYGTEARINNVVDVTTPGDKLVEVKVVFPDHSERYHKATVTIIPYNKIYHILKPERSYLVQSRSSLKQDEINRILKDVAYLNPYLPQGTTFDFKDDLKVVVNYPDCSIDKIDVSELIQEPESKTYLKPIFKEGMMLYQGDRLKIEDVVENFKAFNDRYHFEFLVDTETMAIGLHCLGIDVTFPNGSVETHYIYVKVLPFDR
ncbi:Rib/alpha-like domain-containing protein [Staphylococcus massiliensis]|uniref:Rib/alpha-like domain-containing protein n=1 Tax=Staphylococcus massiliensis TaxID=555791 RepID=UPI001EDD4C0D|nr:Rib/alpha-like domain-containing protein [Staphylococcus massiliensis]MCG3399706.1 hypothetical protein [Staphylococcus massiliensis]